MLQCAHYLVIKFSLGIIPEIGCVVVVTVGSVVDVAVDVGITTELTSVLHNVVLLTVCNIVDTGDK